MTERPILFSGPMVRAILDGRKTMTRRVVRLAVEFADSHCTFPWFTKVAARFLRSFTNRTVERVVDCPYGSPGDILWVRERVWTRPPRTPRSMREGADTWPPYEYDADQHDADREQLREWGWKPRPSIHMPREACRLRLEVADVRVERLQAITDEDAIAEGIEVTPTMTPRASFAALWDAINGKRAPWTDNPWVWVVTFRRKP
jgi:hypothetical protein